ncbi:hypothetical protein M758_11G149800 [Ceratodon purpureus]|nr:hypothetical protein M758_11G149800 [Ceratodon purpureus]
MKCDVFKRSTGKSFNKVFGTRDSMASSGRLLGLQLPSVPSHLSDFMPACVRSSHNGDDAKECCSLASAGSSSSGMMAFDPLCSKLGGSGDMSSLIEAQAVENHSSFALSYTEEGDVEEKHGGKPAEKHVGKEKADGSPPGAESRPTTPSEDVIGKEAGQNSHSQPGRGLRSKLSSMLSLEKRVSLGGLHSSQFMTEMSGFQSNSFARRAPMADSKSICAAIQKESFARMFDLYDDARCYAAPGGYVGRCADGGDIGVRPDLSWMEDKQCNDAWGTEPWHSDQRSILMKTLHIMRCDIESLKMMLRSLDLPAAKGGPLDPHLHETLGYMPFMHPVMMRSNSAMSELKHASDRTADDEQTENRIDSLKEKELAQTADKEHSVEVDKDLCVAEVPPPEKEEESEESISTWSHGCPKKRKQWWRELLAAFGLTVWVITGAVLVAKAIGVPNLGVSNNVAYNGFWERSDDEEKKTPVQGAMGVVELSSYTFNDTIKKRPTFVMFYAPWCPHCQRLHPIWTQLAGVLSKKGYNVQLAIVDATKHSRLADKYEVPGFPTLIMFKDGKPVGRHRGARDIDTLISFIDKNNIVTPSSQRTGVSAILILRRSSTIHESVESKTVKYKPRSHLGIWSTPVGHPLHCDDGWLMEELEHRAYIRNNLFESSQSF